MRTDVSFLTTDGVRLAGWLFLPEKIEGKLPAIVLSHGTGCVKEMGIAPYAEAFAKAGYVALLYDHRNFGESAGEPRAELDPWQQISDMKDAITYLSSLDQVDPDKIGLWGTSYSGGHSIVVTATDRRVKCLVAQVPTMSGYKTATLGLSEQQIADMIALFAQDRLGRMRGDEPMRAKPKPKGNDTGDWLHKASAGTSYRGDLTMRSYELRMGYEPADFIGRISPTPSLMISSRNDSRSPLDEQLEGFAKAREPKKQILIDGGHYDVYDDQKTLDEVIGAALDWFSQHIPA
jgi:fermentation-respiration switch protein FrsA (DUF1100 family)